MSESEEIIKTLLAFIGRLLFPLGELDDWQYVLSIFGNANTGKSVLLDVFRMFYPAGYVTALSNITEGKFGLSQHYKSFIVLMDEITRHIGLEQGVFKGLVTGSLTEIPRKNKDAMMVEWKAQMVVAGNEGMGSYNNAQGSQTRRHLVFQFNERPVAVDRTLKSRVSL